MTTHRTRIATSNGAGQRNHIPYCDTCARTVGNTTTDREQAQSVADTHAADPTAGRR